MGTVGPRDMLYVPASSITLLKVFGDSDTLGVRATFLGGLDAKTLPRVLGDLAAKNVRAEALNLACDFMSGMSERFKAKDAVSQPEEQQAVSAPAKR